MNSPKNRSQEQRKSYRCPVPTDHQQAELQIGRRRQPVRLINESSGGFAAWVDGDVGVATGSVLQLCTPAGDFLVRVVHVGIVGAGPTDSEDGKATYCLGLQRLEDVVGAPEEQRRGRFFQGSLHRTLFFAESKMGLALLATLFVAIVGAGAVAAAIHWKYLGQRPTRTGRGYSPTLAAALKLPDGEEPTLAAVAQHLGLNAPQEAKVRRVIESAAETLGELDRRWQDDEPEVRARKQAIFFDAAWREVLQALTPEQRAHWEAVMQ
jgi:hypothetical protein